MTAETKETKFEAVIFTDGGAKPQPGYGGWGLHAKVNAAPVFYTSTTLLEEEHPDNVVLDNHRRAFGLKKPMKTWEEIDGDTYVPEEHIVNYPSTSLIDAYGALPFPTTNNQAEMEALSNTLDIIADKGWKSVLIVCDSKYVLQGINKIIRHGGDAILYKSDGTAAANPELWKVIQKKCIALVDADVFIEWDWVKGHSGNDGNERADDGATRGRVVSHNGDPTHRRYIESAVEGYGKQTKSKVCPLICQKHWYFTSQSTDVESGATYYIGNHGKEDMLPGEPRSRSCAAVVKLKTADPFMEMVVGAHRKEWPESINVTIGSLDNINAPATRTELEKNDVVYLARNRTTRGLSTHFQRTLTAEIDPPRLVFRLMGYMESMESLLDDYVGERLGKNITVTDIADYIYDIDAKGKLKVKPPLGAVEKALRVTVPYKLPDGTVGPKSIKLTLTLGTDIATRNALSAMVKSKPQVKLLCWPETSAAVRYATIVETEDGVGIYSATQSNLQLISK